MHRHMIQSLKQLWPKHSEQFEGWEHFPTKASDVPAEWQKDWSAWMANIATAGAQADDPAKNMNVMGFESEGGVRAVDSNHQRSCTARCTSSGCARTTPSTASAISSRTSTTTCSGRCTAGSTKFGIANRAAKGKTPNGPRHQRCRARSVRQMDQLALIVKLIWAPRPALRLPHRQACSSTTIRRSSRTPPTSARAATDRPGPTRA